MPRVTGVSQATPSRSTAASSPERRTRISYRAAHPPVAGLGYVAVRDTTAWLKNQPDAPGPCATRTGTASSRVDVSSAFLYKGSTPTARSAGLRRRHGAHRRRGATQSKRTMGEAHRARCHSATPFPFADASLRDPISGAQDGLLDNPDDGHAPKVFYTNTPVEYWAPAAWPRSSTHAGRLRRSPAPRQRTATSSPARSIHQPFRRR